MDSETDVVLPKALPISLPIVSLNFVQKLARKPKSQRPIHFGPPTPQIVAIAQRTPAVPEPQTLPGPLRPPLFSAVPSAFFTLYLTFVAAVPYNPPMFKSWVDSFSWYPKHWNKVDKPCQVWAHHLSNLNKCTMFWASCPTSSQTVNVKSMLIIHTYPSGFTIFSMLTYQIRTYQHTANDGLI